MRKGYEQIQKQNQNTCILKLSNAARCFDGLGLDEFDGGFDGNLIGADLFAELATLTHAKVDSGRPEIWGRAGQGGDEVTGAGKDLAGQFFNGRADGVTDAAIEAVGESE